MDTTRKHGSDGRENTMRMSVWLMCIAVAVVANGCAGCWGTVRSPTPTDSTPLPTNACSSGGCDAPKHAVAGLYDCPTGNCDPGNLNGKGIYTVEEGNYCFFNLGDGRFCPEAIANAKEGVVMELRDRKRPLLVQRKVVFAKYRASDNALPVDARLLGIHGDRTQLSLRYTLGGEESIATGADLLKFTFSVNSLETGSGDASPLVVGYEFKVTPVGQENGLYQYTVQYRDVSTDQWMWHCQGDAKQRQPDSLVTFLPQQRVSGVSAYTREDSNVLTMACESGAIVTCMSWGYTPWDEKTGQLDNNRNHVFRSCLQAKRAAYFVGHGDIEGYTQTGTEIFLRDQYGINEAGVPHLEAIWSPTGAVCVNADNLRHLKFQPDVIKNANLYHVPLCSQPPSWSPEGKLATSPKVLAQ